MVKREWVNYAKAAPILQEQRMLVNGRKLPRADRLNEVQWSDEVEGGRVARNSC
jgi:hypothetical protein